MNQRTSTLFSQIIAIGLLMVFFSACKSRQYSRNNKKIEKEATRSNPDFKSHTTVTYIEDFKGVAIEEMNKYGIPASITLAQGIIESGSGNSSLAKFANNHFGIKCTSDWKGKGYFKDDDKKDDCFRVYKDARESYRDHSEFLKRKRYSALFELDKNDYKNWALGLKAAGYATNPRYPDMLINIIDKYKLYQYDQPETETEKMNREDKVFTEINANIPQEKKKFTPVETPPSKQVLKTPDTLKISAPVVNDDIPPAPVYVPSSRAKSAVKPAAVAPVKTPAAQGDTTQGDSVSVIRPVAQDSTPVTAPVTTVTLPIPADKSYTVQKGDTLYNISRRFNVAVDEIKALNSLNDAGIKIGQKLVLAK
ncbi:MAG TPA: glucosaminidase domain-containing protein [Pedobacter sp.]|uniref:glucosaminidase domain-containing protein n=1 Tax=Pedobacter sp. TaxID=1411316 RepID=UPI002CC28760|nr:glucosaminidase domain-containing protein [Pedobacter sp.]HMI00997.1 glucosaminidase domain-containing protein [Pedobacter sp.]